MVAYYPSMRLSLTEIAFSEWIRGEVPSQEQITEYMKILHEHIEAEKQAYLKMISPVRRWMQEDISNLDFDKMVEEIDNIDIERELNLQQ